jgi:hypothetical protein
MIYRGSMSFPEKEWAHTGPDAITLIRRLLDPNATTRITAAELLQHPWIGAGTPAATFSSKLQRVIAEEEEREREQEQEQEQEQEPEQAERGGATAADAAAADAAAATTTGTSEAAINLVGAGADAMDDSDTDDDAYVTDDGGDETERPTGVVRVFIQKFTLEDAVGSHAMFA